MKKLMTALALVVLASMTACGTPEEQARWKAAVEEDERYMAGGHVQRVAEAPDGTTLYRVRCGDRDVYFSRGGTQWQTTHNQMVGKVTTTTTQTHQVPNQQ